MNAISQMPQLITERNSDSPTGSELASKLAQTPDHSSIPVITQDTPVHKSDVYGAFPEVFDSQFFTGFAESEMSMKAVGLEPTTNGLKVRCSTN